MPGRREPGRRRARAFGGSQREAHDPVPAKILVKVDNGAVQTLENAEVRPWNDKYIGVVASGRTPDVLAVIHSIGTATRKIEVGLELADKQFSIGFGASGSTAAISAPTEGLQTGRKGFVIGPGSQGARASTLAQRLIIPPPPRVRGWTAGRQSLAPMEPNSVETFDPKLTAAAATAGTMPAAITPYSMAVKRLFRSTFTRSSRANVSANG